MAKKDKIEGEKKARAPRKAKAAAPKAKSETGSVVNLEKYGSRYEVHDERTASGRKAVDVGDRVAKALRTLSVSDVIKVVSDNDGKVNPKWKDLNAGLARMAAGNVLRGIVRSGKTVDIKGTKVASL